MTAVMLVLIWFPSQIGWPTDQQTQVTTPAIYFADLDACKAAIPAVQSQVVELNPAARVSAKCYDSAEDPRG